MRWRPAKLALFVGLCSAGLTGCASLRLTGDPTTLGSATVPATASPSANVDPVSQFGLSSAKAETAAPKAAGQPQDSVLESQFALARLCERRGEKESAKEFYCVMLKKAPRDARLHHRLGVLAVQEGDFATAEGHFSTARSLAPPTAELLSDIGYCFYLQHRLPEADGALNDALKLEPTNAAAINNLALLRGKEGRFQESLELFKRTNTEAEAYANLAYVLAQNGELAQAREMYLRALTLDNGMRAAAQAVLQIDDRNQSQSRLVSASFGPHLVAPAASEPVQGPGQTVPLPEAIGRGPQSVGPEVTVRPPS